MRVDLSRRTMLEVVGAAAVAGSPAAAAVKVLWPPVEGPGTPKLCLEAWAGRVSGTTDDAVAMRRIVQLGVTHVLSGAGRLPWREEQLRAQVDRLKTGGLTLANLMIGGFQNTVYGRPGRDEEIEKVKLSIRAAGRAGVPVIEYNFYANRLMEGYHEEIGRGGAGMTAYGYERARNLPPRPEIGVHKLDEMWRNIAYFLKAVVPVAEDSGVKLALHPNDPPVPLSRGSEQIMGTLAGWKRLIEVVDSPANGITFDCGVTREMGEDPVEVCRFFASRKRINHVHFRNVKVRKPYEDYTEVFPDEGQVDMFGVMRELVRQKYTGVVYPEHPRALDVDRERPGYKPYYPGGGEYVGLTYNVAYARAMLQAALATA